MNVIYQKIWADLWGHKARTLQIALVVALGAFGIGLVVGARNLITEAVSADWRAVTPPAINLNVNPPMTDEQVIALKNIDGVVAAEGLVTTLIEWRANPEQEWQSAFLNARTDYLEQQMSKDFLAAGAWPTRNEFGVALGAERFFGIKAGDTIWLRINERERQVKIGGVIKSIRAAPFFTGNPDFYATRARFADLVGNADYNTLQVSIGAFEQQRAEMVDNAIKARLEKLGIDSKGGNQPLGNRIASPDVTPAGALLDALFAIMGLVGSVIIFLGLFLVFNSVSAIITQQTDQIGVMKAIGARAGQILSGYMILIFSYGLLATLISVPLGAVAANGLKNFFLDFTNSTNPGFQVDPLAVAIQIGVALVTPLAAALFPLLKGVRITVREAISSYGLSGTAGLIDRLVARINRVPYSVLLTIGNTFRNQQRVVLIQFTLIGSGLIFMIVMGVADSTQYTFDRALRGIHNYQVATAFTTPQRLRRIEQIALAQPDVKTVEIWNTAQVTVRPISQAKTSVDDKQATLLGLPAQTRVYAPQIESGRWLQPDDEYVVVIHKALAEKIGVRVGDKIILTRDGDKDSTWTVVGTLFDPVTNQSIHLPRATLARFLGTVNRGNALWVQTTTTDAQRNKEIALALEKTFTERNIKVAPETIFNGNTIDDISFGKLFTYDLLVQLLAIMAVVIAIVGGVGLSGVLSLSVLERTREIGVMRAIGASSSQITRLFIGEGLLLGFLSWAIALPLSIPLAYALTTRLLTIILSEEIIYRFTPFGALLWLAIISVLAILASWFPARSATRVSVRQSLAYQ